MGPYGSIWTHTRPYGSICVRGSIWTIWIHLGPSFTDVFMEASLVCMLQLSYLHDLQYLATIFARITTGMLSVGMVLTKVHAMKF